jgi:hypothetical protein
MPAGSARSVTLDYVAAAGTSTAPPITSDGERVVSITYTLRHDGAARE